MRFELTDSKESLVFETSALIQTMRSLRKNIDKAVGKRILKYPFSITDYDLVRLELSQLSLELFNDTCVSNRISFAKQTNSIFDFQDLHFFSHNNFSYTFKILCNYAWRREWDSNPRTPKDLRFSRPVHSSNYAISP